MHPNKDHFDFDLNYAAHVLQESITKSNGTVNCHIVADVYDVMLLRHQLLLLKGIIFKLIFSVTHVKPEKFVILYVC